MPGRFGEAAAGARTLGDPCDLPLCSGTGDAEAWWAQGQIWVAFTKQLEAEAEAVLPRASWPLELKLQAETAAEAMKVFADEQEPWVVFKARIEQWAAAQQTLRNYAGELADLVDPEGTKIGKGVAPADAPANPGALAGALQSLVKIAGFGVAGWLAIQLLQRRR